MFTAKGKASYLKSMDQYDETSALKARIRQLENGYDELRTVCNRLKAALAEAEKEADVWNEAVNNAHTRLAEVAIETSKRQREKDAKIADKFDCLENDGGYCRCGLQIANAILAGGK